MFLLLLLCVAFAGFGAVLFLKSRAGAGEGSRRQIAELYQRVDELEQNAVAATNELRRLEDSQRFTERLLAARTLARSDAVSADAPSPAPGNQ